MNWMVNFHDAFIEEFSDFPGDVKIELKASVTLLQTFGPQLGRPHADTLRACLAKKISAAKAVKSVHFSENSRPIAHYYPRICEKMPSISRFFASIFFTKQALNSSKYAKMKELRFNASGGVWRVAYAFDPDRAAILLVAGDKRGKDLVRFYKRLITRADERFGAHLKTSRGD